MRKLKIIYHDLFAIVAWGWILAHFILIAIYGSVIIYEPNMWILWAEIVFTGLLVGLGIWRLIGDIK